VKTAVDSSVLLDVLGADSRFAHGVHDARPVDAAARSWRARSCGQVRAHSDVDFRQSLALLGVRFEPIVEAAAVAGRLWRESRRRRTEFAGAWSRTFSWALTVQQADALLTGTVALSRYFGVSDRPERGQARILLQAKPMNRSLERFLTTHTAACRGRTT
jgi:hypothetical protein